MPGGKERCTIKELWFHFPKNIKLIFGLLENSQRLAEMEAQIEALKKDIEIWKTGNEHFWIKHVPGAVTDRNLDTENQSISYSTAYYSGSAFGGMESHSNFLINSFNRYFW